MPFRDRLTVELYFSLLQGMYFLDICVINFAKLDEVHPSVLSADYLLLAS